MNSTRARGHASRSSESGSVGLASQGLGDRLLDHGLHLHCRTFSDSPLPGLKLGWPTSIPGDTLFSEELSVQDQNFDVRAVDLLMDGIDIMLSSGPLTTRSHDQWDHPLLQEYIEREAEVEDNYLGDDEEADEQIVLIWREAVEANPNLESTFLHLAAALRESDRHQEAAEVLRSGIERGHTELWSHLLKDYPTLVEVSELEEVAHDARWSERAFSAMLAQGQTDLALALLPELLEPEDEASNAPRLVPRDLVRLIGLLLAAGQSADARATFERLDGLTRANSLERPTVAALGELLTAASTLDADLCAALVQLHLSHGIVDVWEALERRNATERRSIFRFLFANCPEYSRMHRDSLRRLQRALVPHHFSKWSALLTLGAALLIWYLYRYPH